MKADYDRSAQVTALLNWLRSQNLSTAETGRLLSDLAAVIIVQFAEATGDVETFIDGVSAFHHDFLATAIRLYKQSLAKNK